MFCDGFGDFFDELVGNAESEAIVGDEFCLQALTWSQAGARK